MFIGIQQYIEQQFKSSIDSKEAYSLLYKLYYYAHNKFTEFYRTMAKHINQLIRIRQSIKYIESKFRLGIRQDIILNSIIIPERLPIKYTLSDIKQIDVKINNNSLGIHGDSDFVKFFDHFIYEGIIYENTFVEFTSNFLDISDSIISETNDNATKLSNLYKLVSLFYGLYYIADYYDMDDDKYTTDICTKCTPEILSRIVHFVDDCYNLNP